MTISIVVDGERFSVKPGISLAGALFEVGKKTTRQTARSQHPRSLFCGMGVCYDCVVNVDGRDNVRACQTLVQNEMQIRTQRGEPSLANKN